MKWLPNLPGSLPPRRALVLGKIVFLAGAIPVVGAVFARASLSAVNVQRVEAKLPAFRTLAEAYPQYPTWVVPEGPLGYTLSAVLLLMGLALIVVAERAAKQGRAFPS